MSTTDSGNSGVKVEFKGTRAAATATVNMTTAGYAPQSATYATTVIGAATSSAATYYLQGVRLAAPSSGTATFFIEVPNGSTSEFIKFMFHVDTSGNVYVDDGTA
jgi:hypothetical protein